MRMRIQASINEAVRLLNQSQAWEFELGPGIYSSRLVRALQAAEFAIRDAEEQLRRAEDQRADEPSRSVRPSTASLARRGPASRPASAGQTAPQATGALSASSAHPDSPLVTVKTADCRNYTIEIGPQVGQLARFRVEANGGYTLSFTPQP